MEGALAAALLEQVTEQLNHHTAGSSDALPVHVLEFGGQAQQDTLQEIVKGGSVYEPAGYSQQLLLMLCPAGSCLCMAVWWLSSEAGRGTYGHVGSLDVIGARVEACVRSVLVANTEDVVLALDMAPGFNIQARCSLAWPPRGAAVLHGPD